MKFGHDFQEHLVQGGFPAHWVASAISYRQLKKCIKRVQRELAGLGLDAATLAQLLSTVEGQSEGNRPGASQAAKQAAEEQAGQPVLYLLSQSGAATPASGRRFQPKLLFAVDPVSGEPVDARLAPETKEYLHQLALSEQLTSVRIAEVEDDETEYRRGSVTAPSFVSSSTGSTARTVRDGDNDDFENESEPRRAGSVRLIEIPLTSDSDFFNLLQSELSGLAALQADEQRKLNGQVTDLSNVITKVTQPSRSSAKNDLSHWRQIFELYLDSRIFFATNEQDHGAHDSKRAQQNFQKFFAQLQEKHLDSHFRRKESRESLEMFLKINMDLLQMLKFQEINRTAMTKILKKFDKRTSLDVKEVFPKVVQMPALSENVAKAVCYQVSTDLLTVVPQLDDYLCPVCFSVSYKPIRLRCQHVFCIRCLVVMQREGKDKCPLCRGSVVMEADSTNIDAGLANFLIKFFPEEVKAKQKENERAAGVDQYGEAYNDKCHVM